jgi:hypothetical protein
MIHTIKNFFLIVKTFFLDKRFFLVYFEFIMKIENLAKQCKVHPDTLYKAKRKGSMSKSLAKKLENITGIKRLMWLYPDEYGDPWRLINEN